MDLIINKINIINLILTRMGEFIKWKINKKLTNKLKIENDFNHETN